MLEALGNTWPSCSSHLKKSFVLLMQLRSLFNNTGGHFLDFLLQSIIRKTVKEKFSTRRASRQWILRLQDEFYVGVLSMSTDSDGSGLWTRVTEYCTVKLSKQSVDVRQLIGFSVEFEISQLWGDPRDGSQVTVMAARISHLSSRCLQRSTLSRYLSSYVDNKAFTKTLLLPKTSFVLRPDPKQIDSLYRKLTCDDLYRWQVSGLGCIFFVSG